LLWNMRIIKAKVFQSIRRLYL